MAKMNRYYVRMYLGTRGTDKKIKKKNRSLKVVHETLDELIYFLEKQKNIIDEFTYIPPEKKEEKDVIIFLS